MLKERAEARAGGGGGAAGGSIFFFFAFFFVVTKNCPSVLCHYLELYITPRRPTVESASERALQPLGRIPAATKVSRVADSENYAGAFTKGSDYYYGARGYGTSNNKAVPARRHAAPESKKEAAPQRAGRAVPFLRAQAQA